MGEPGLQDNVITVTFSRHARSSGERQSDDEMRSCQFNLTRYKDNDTYALLCADKKYYIKIFNNVPKDAKLRAYWTVYTTNWNSFAAYSDYKNSNMSCELMTYVSVQVGTNKSEFVDGVPYVADGINIDSADVTKFYEKNQDDFDPDAHLIEDMITALMCYLTTRGSKAHVGKRVSHINYGVDGETPKFEYVSNKPLRTADEAVWRYL